jgi:hypothetical protein
MHRRNRAGGKRKWDVAGSLTQRLQRLFFSLFPLSVPTSFPLISHFWLPFSFLPPCRVVLDLTLDPPFACFSLIHKIEEFVCAILDV